MSGRPLDIWFYIGALLDFYGVLLTFAGAYQWAHPPSTVLADKHATFWAGVALLLVGTAYVISCWPNVRQAEGKDRPKNGRE